MKKLFLLGVVLGALAGCGAKEEDKANQNLNSNTFNTAGGQQYCGYIQSSGYQFSLQNEQTGGAFAFTTDQNAGNQIMQAIQQSSFGMAYGCVNTSQQTGGYNGGYGGGMYVTQVSNLQPYNASTGSSQCNQYGCWANN